MVIQKINHNVIKIYQDTNRSAVPHFQLGFIQGLKLDEFTYFVYKTGL